MLRSTLCIISLALAAATAAVQAQQAPAGATTFSSQPGRVAAAQAVKVSALVTAIDPAARALTLKTADGKSFDVVAGPEVRNFDQIKLNDRVVAQYIRALTLELRKGGSVRESGATGAAVQAEKGQKPGAAVGGRLTIVADVVDVNQKDKTISLRGPKGNVVVLEVQNPEHFKVVKKGDQVEADYAEALAVSVEPASK